MALAIERSNTEAYFLSGLVYISEGNTSTAIKAFENAIKTDLTFSPAYLSIADIKRNTNNLSETIQTCQQCL